MASSPRTLTVLNRRRRLTALMLLLPSADLVQLRDAWLNPGRDAGPPSLKLRRALPKRAFVRAGSIWRPHRELARQRPQRSTHLHFDDIFDAIRGAQHAVRGYGTSASEAPSELVMLKRDVEEARRFVRCVLHLGVYDPAERAALMQAETALTVSYMPKRNLHKVRARGHLLRGLDMKDARGRKNPMAAAMVTGAGIGELLKRVNQALNIRACIDRRSFELYRIMDAHMDVYRDCWDDFSPQRGLVHRFVRTRNIDDLENLLRGHLQTFDAMVVQPFCGNARRLCLDLRLGLSYLDSANFAAFGVLCGKIRNGLRWMFALYALEMEVISPLSGTLERLRNAHRFAERKTPRSKLRFVRALDPEAFRLVEESFASFRARLRKCSDKGLSQPVLPRLTPHLDAAQADMEADDWLAVRRALLLAARTM